jgi:AGCS family alanine or glycine:cation symporter
MDILQESLIDPISAFLWNYVLVYLLIGAGIYFTIRTRFVQFRLFGRMLTLITESRAGAEGGISSFQAFSVGLASRVGTGNIAGVAIALTLGGPGAVFWMWMVALLGMATAFVESALAQVYKIPWEDKSFRGGPAYYIQRGLGSRTWGSIFALLLIFAFGIAFNMVQANTISDVINDRVTEGWVALILMVLVAPVLFGGIRRVATVAEKIFPPAAAIYVLMAVVVIALNITEIPGVIADIVGAAFGLGEAAAGIAGGIAAAMLNGVKRGLFSNEAGMGSAPNAAATATTTHPAKQGLIQSLGVFVDTILVCSATAFIILLAGPSVYDPGTTTDAQGASLTQAALTEHFGSWSAWVLAVIVTVLAFSSILGNYSYSEGNLEFLGIGNRGLTVFRFLVLLSVGIGSMLALEPVWALADVGMGLMAVVNLVAILLLFPMALGVLKDFEAQWGVRHDADFAPQGNEFLPKAVESDAWPPPWHQGEESVPAGGSDPVGGSGESPGTTQT